ncbi:hypothetical protein [Antiquaquibacter soli]|uniref:Alpha-L-rhamnosidase six-hairpin glycosidase domain-containing protein n=1 Tax=Antiquaquibacter soli TaxID=3064523 RepID=A0ABT9BLP5_9MICO|nr:hypothetical protein [Protaetiibacter sp. WY-16]MDO7881930.1 hypothetical protein [Protaetiibacter sp. WY-16]
MSTNLFVHPLATSQWESLPAATTRIHTRSVWASRETGESTAPHQRIIHLRAIFSDAPMSLESVRVVPGAGYHKCASGQESDEVVDARVWEPAVHGWTQLGRVGGAGSSLDLGGAASRALVVEIRQASTDRWWPGWNLAATGLELIGEAPAEWQPRREGRLEVDDLDLSGLPDGVSAEHRGVEVRYRTPRLSVGFRLRSPAWSHLSVDDDGTGRTDRSLLQQPRSMDIVRSGVYPSGVYPVLRDQNAEYLAQGPRVTRADGDRPVGFLASDYEGVTTVRGNVVTYDVSVPSAGQRYRYRFTVLADRIELDLRRTAAEDYRAWTSSAWHIATDNRVTPSTAIGELVTTGETGLLRGDVLWHFPRFGTFEISSDSPDLLMRSDSVRALDTNTLEFKLGETPTPFGDYLLPAGDYRARIVFAARTPRLASVAPDAPAPVRRMLDRHALTALPFRADTATYSNNGASMHCTTTLNDISAIATGLGDLLPGVSPLGLVGASLSRWLDGAPSYGSGSTSHGPHRLEDEYVHMAANTLVAVGRYLGATNDSAWFARHRDRVLAEIEDMLARDVDGDGLVESTIRLGNSGEHQWSTAWSDVISFGWKDAWANAVLFEAWTELAPVLRDRGEQALSDRVSEAARRIQEAYLPAFYSETTGLIAGWRSRDGELHDYGFSLVNGAACSTELLPADIARAIMTRLREHWDAVGVPDLRNGVPLNLWRIPESDIGGVVFGLPMGGYQQGGCSHHGARVIVDAFDRVGMRAEADELLVALATSIADDSSFGGLGSGVDWRMWDGTPSGYEGQLAEGFSVLASALRRFGR